VITNNTYYDEKKGKHIIWRDVLDPIRLRTFVILSGFPTHSN